MTQLSEENLREAQEKQNLLILESLERLRRNKDYQVVVNSLKDFKEYTEALIYDENTDHEQKRALIVKRNTIQNFIELPNDLIQEYTPS